MEPIAIPTDDEIRQAAAAFAQIIDPGNKTRFIEDFTIGAKWMRYKMRKMYEDPQALKPKPVPMK